MIFLNLRHEDLRSRAISDIYIYIYSTRTAMTMAYVYTVNKQINIMCIDR